MTNTNLENEAIDAWKKYCSELKRVFRLNNELIDSSGLRKALQSDSEESLKKFIFHCNECIKSLAEIVE
jgi:hypothetical protein